MHYNLSVMHIRRVGVCFFVAQVWSLFFSRILILNGVFVVKRIVYIVLATRSILTIDFMNMSILRIHLLFQQLQKKTFLPTYFCFVRHCLNSAHFIFVNLRLTIHAIFVETFVKTGYNTKTKLTFGTFNFHCICVYFVPLEPNNIKCLKKKA